ncbi:helix-turn-helix domain-containing protein [Streptomyces sp. DSM 44915]|uniref:Helix-turn-helix domain-containing protein n=1 Tax=Streptomyces chisholmiae TaxID=3075540 RepID=A0ABU2JQ49_9ACTN|nr:helix-turn-helix domain-containing protein [Streptomyces sp. DSM 44915]MDT0266863.1 helix-turn-helix domain-containing protein [Streptomyces sp. DSM 44915]
MPTDPSAADPTPEPAGTSPNPPLTTPDADRAALDDQRGRPPSRVELDARGLRALAHPVRVRLLGLLRVHGPATATRLAERLELTSGATSYHLRRLAAAGFVEEDAERGNARERWWRSAHESTSFRGLELLEKEPEAALGYLRSVVAAHALAAQQALNALETLPAAWQPVVSFSDALLRLTPGEAERMQRELYEVVGRYRRHDLNAAPDAAPAGAERVQVVLHVLPTPGGGPDDDGPGGAGEAGS